jgi:hypothetical protein
MGLVTNTATAFALGSASDFNEANDAGSDETLVLVPGACGAFDERRLGDQTVAGVEIIEACTSIRVGNGFVLAATGDLTLRSPFIFVEPVVAFEQGSKLVVETSVP